jgi:starch synthase
MLRIASSARRRELQRRVLYTSPLEPVAGQLCDVFYNPDATTLRGRPDVFVRGAWNRWTHPELIPTTRMTPTLPGGIGWLKVWLCRVVLAQQA